MISKLRKISAFELEPIKGFKMNGSEQLCLKKCELNLSVVKYFFKCKFLYFYFHEISEFIL